jgi:mono/diheme cytochrome c family protein
MNTRTKLGSGWLVCALALPGAALAQAQPLKGPAATAAIQWNVVKATLPAGDVDFPAGDGSMIATAQCLICHSAGTVLRQPPQPQAQWLAEIRKMRALWGAPIPVDEEQALSRYLARINGPK